MSPKSDSPKPKLPKPESSRRLFLQTGDSSYKQGFPNQSLKSLIQNKKDSLKQDSPKQDSNKQDSPKQDPPKQDSNKQDSPTLGSSKKDFLKQGTPKQDFLNEDSSKQDVPKQKYPKRDIPKQDSPKQDPPKQDSPKQDSSKQDSLDLNLWRVCENFEVRLTEQGTTESEIPRKILKILIRCRDKKRLSYGQQNILKKWMKNYGVKYGSLEKLLEVLNSEEVKEEKRKEAQNSE